MKQLVMSKILVPFFILAALAFSTSQVAAGGAPSGNFIGKSDHITTGKATLVKVSNGYLVKLGKDFSLDGAPAPSVGFGKNGNYDKSTNIGDLESNTGEQFYVIPASVDISKYNELYIWCDKFDVPLGVATLN